MSLAAALNVLLVHSHCTDGGNKLSARLRANRKHLACISDEYRGPTHLVAMLWKGKIP